MTCVDVNRRQFLGGILGSVAAAALPSVAPAADVGPQSAARGEVRIPHDDAMDPRIVCAAFTARVLDERDQDVQLPIRNRDGLAGKQQAPPGGIQFIHLERESHAGHGTIIHRTPIRRRHRHPKTQKTQTSAGDAEDADGHGVFRPSLREALIARPIPGSSAPAATARYGAATTAAGLPDPEGLLDAVAARGTDHFGPAQHALGLQLRRLSVPPAEETRARMARARERRSGHLGCVAQAVFRDFGRWGRFAHGRIVAGSGLDGRRPGFSRLAGKLDG